MKKINISIELPDEVDLMNISERIHSIYKGDEAYKNSDTLLNINNDQNEIILYHDLESASAFSNVVFMSGFESIMEIIRKDKDLSDVDWDLLCKNVLERNEES